MMLATKQEPWPRTKVESLSEYITVGFVGSMSSLFCDEGVPLLRGQNIRPYSLDLTNLKYISQETHRKWKKSALKPGDVVIVRVGYPGTACVIPEGLGDINAASLVIVRPNKALLDSKYLSYVFNSPWGKAQVAGRQVGAAQQVFNTQTAAELEIPAPPLPVQRRIAGILSAYDELIENSQRRIRLLEDMARALYREWFVHFRFPGHESVPHLPSTLGDIPQGWEVKKLGEICSKLMDGTHDSPPPVAVGYPLITGRHIKGGFIDFSNAYFISPEEHEKVMKRSRPERGDIIYSNIGTLGETALVDQDFEYSIKNVALLKPLTPLHSSFIYCYLESPGNLAALTNKASGTSQKFFSLQFLRGIELIVPPRELLALFTEKLSPILTARSTFNKQIQNLRRTRDLLLPRLLSGQVALEEAAN